MDEVLEKYADGLCRALMMWCKTTSDDLKDEVFGVRLVSSLYTSSQYLGAPTGYSTCCRSEHSSK